MHKVTHKPVKNGILHMHTHTFLTLISIDPPQTHRGPEQVGRDGGVQMVLLHLLRRSLYKSLRSTTNSLYTQGQHADGIRDSKKMITIA